MIAQLYAPYIGDRVIIVRVLRVEAVAALPDAFPIVELVGCPGLFGLVVDRQLHPAGRTEHEGFAAPVGAGLGGPA